MIGTVLRVRAVPRGLVAVVLAAGLSAFAGTHVLWIDLSPANPTRLPVAELCGILAATALAVLTRPRVWEWDRVARSRRARVVAGAVAVAGVTLPTACVFAVAVRLPAGTAWGWVVADTVVVAALVFVAAPFVRPVWAGLVAVVVWYGCGVLGNIVPGVAPYLPTSAYPAAEAHWWWAGALAVVAIGVQVRTLGAVALRED
ncbi:hypothetical protein [Saccharomonospora iraqiensis]|uniref:hypothetical protein n=1 Tax=Saccharomonospora iraqiensis TaxID=52698 RepID=UPI00022E0AE3|nr:hypothetical protein [Saccharomonospora iraqiensis]